jgi:hypothetical protein
VDTSRFRPNGPELAVLDLRTGFEFKTASSVGFNLGHSRPAGFFVVGPLEVHHPCEGHVKAHFVAPGRQSGLLQHTDRNGVTDVFFA